MISGYRFFELYTAINLHFKAKTSYDFFKYGGKLRVAEETFTKRKDKYFFEKFAHKCQDEDVAVGLIVSNILNGTSYIKGYDLEAYKSKWIQYKEGLLYNFESEYRTFLDKQSTAEKQETPLIVRLLMNNEVSPEFAILLDIAYEGNLFQSLTDKEDFIWCEHLKGLCEKYRPFIAQYWSPDPQALRNVISKLV